MQAFSLTPDQLKDFLATGKLPTGATPVNLDSSHITTAVLQAFGVDGATDDKESAEKNADLVDACGGAICEALGNAIGVHPYDDHAETYLVIDFMRKRLDGIASVAYSIGKWTAGQPKGRAALQPPTRDEVVTDADAEQIANRAVDMCAFFLGTLGQPQGTVMEQSPKGAAVRAAVLKSRDLAENLFRDAYVRALGTI
jgi:hypothetical protein